MQTINLKGLAKLLHPNAAEIPKKLSHSNYGIPQPEEPVSKGNDTFTITQKLSELLSPACGMTKEEKKAWLDEIMAKLKSGKKLSGEEMRFLQAENPALYQQVARVQALRASFEERLNSSSTKEEAQTMFSRSVSLVSKDDPMREYIIAAYNDVMDEFKESDAYQALPSEAEEKKQRPG